MMCRMPLLPLTLCPSVVSANATCLHESLPLTIDTRAEVLSILFHGFLRLRLRFRLLQIMICLLHLLHELIRCLLQLLL